MKKLLVFTVAFGFFACVPASAQSGDHRGDRHRDAAPAATHATTDSHGRTEERKGGETSRTVNTHRNMSGAAGAASLGDSRKHAPSAATVNNEYLPASGDSHRVQNGRAIGDKKHNNSGWSGNAAGRPAARNSRQGRSNWSANMSGRHPDVSAFRRNMQATERFRGGSYSAPQGYQHRHWSYGERLPRGYFVRNYWIANFMVYGLFAPPPELVWVRVGDDALLIDQESGEIVQVRYSVFY